jgi:hypothetical protein
MRKIIRRIERDVGVPNLSQILVDRITPTDLQSLLLKVYQSRVERRTPADVFADYRSNSFTGPSRCDPARLLAWDHIAFAHLPEEFHAIELSPVTPIGSVSRVAPISQDWVLTTIRNMEVVADPTNELALECARRRQELTQSEPTGATPVHLACSHRVVRAQRYRSSGAHQHFRLFSLCSAGRTTGHLQFEIPATIKHIRFYLAALRDFLGSAIPLRVTIIDLTPDAHDDAIFSTRLENLRNEFNDVHIRLETAQTRGTAYYRAVRFHVSATAASGPELELVEGGDTDWTQQLLNNAKERLVISGIGTERLCEKFTPIRQSSPE